MPHLILGVDIGTRGGLALVTGEGDLVFVAPMPVLNDGPAGRLAVNAPPEFDPLTLPGRRPRHESAYPLRNLNRMILGVLRRRGELMAVHEVADAIAAEMNYGEAAMRSVQERVRYALKSMAKGEKASVRKEGWRETARWGLAQASPEC